MLKGQFKITRVQHHGIKALVGPVQSLLHRAHGGNTSQGASNVVSHYKRGGLQPKKYLDGITSGEIQKLLPEQCVCTIHAPWECLTPFVGGLVGEHKQTALTVRARGLHRWAPGNFCKNAPRALTSGIA